MGQQDLGILLEEGGDGLHGRALCDEVQRDEAVGAHAQLDRAGGQQLGHVHAGTALDDLDVQAAPFVGPGGESLIEAAVLGLGAPVGGEADANPALLVDGGLRVSAGGEAHGGDRDAAGQKQAAADDGLSRAGRHRRKLGPQGMQGKRTNSLLPVAQRGEVARRAFAP